MLIDIIILKSVAIVHHLHKAPLSTSIVSWPASYIATSFKTHADIVANNM